MDHCEWLWLRDRDQNTDTKSLSMHSKCAAVLHLDNANRFAALCIGENAINRLLESLVNMFHVAPLAAPVYLISTGLFAALSPSSADASRTVSRKLHEASIDSLTGRSNCDMTKAHQLRRSVVPFYSPINRVEEHPLSSSPNQRYVTRLLVAAELMFAAKASCNQIIHFKVILRSLRI